ncbi:thiamine diphosphokinase [Aquibacillus halophilus]|uniref:Thiamine diphosphokinase n=1 Tax=Aquibacillus halophilus TaxID=930132 RepID=A0A6A8D8Y0_9BACI|nr:thiamine diphosphokinase [Aquibacillus halophilus]MRH42215.1 thiamine diphosphokinase [Aquibacillus halophilus]
MSTIAIVAGGPTNNIPILQSYNAEINTWIGADKGAMTLLNQKITPDIAIGDFDSITESELKLVKQESHHFEIFPIEKDETDLELAVKKALELKPTKIYLFGVTGGRLDHGMASIQLLYKLIEEKVSGIIIDGSNQMELKAPGVYHIYDDPIYSNISFLPFSQKVIGISLEGFYYSLSNTTINWGSTLCISNKLLLEKGTFSFREGILLVIKSRDVLN